MDDLGIARCHCGGVEMHLPLALFVTPLDRAPHVNSFPEKRPDWAPFHALPGDA